MIVYLDYWFEIKFWQGLRVSKQELVVEPMAAEITPQGKAMVTSALQNRFTLGSSSVGMMLTL
jgi:hypothetical protein